MGELKPNETAARDFLALVKIALIDDPELMTQLIGSWTPIDAINALVSGAAQHARVLEMLTTHDRAVGWVDDRLAEFAAMS